MRKSEFAVLLILFLTLISTQVTALDIKFTKVSNLGGVVDIRNAGDGSNRLFLVGQSGTVRIVKNGVTLDEAFLNIGERISSGGERGLLSLAFAPDYAQSGYFYVWYTDSSSDTRLSRFSVTGDADIADPDSEKLILSIAQPQTNHNGGRLLFGPDGYLYLSTGDGGGANDPLGNGQNMGTLLGKILRLDVDPSHQTYAIPADNPFVGENGILDEIWASGLRNPWKMSFDSDSGGLYIADVGQSNFEEVNFQAANSTGGENYGWNTMEGSQCFQGGCDTFGLTLPVAEYSHGAGCSITGGEVYRGSSYPELNGSYLYGDYCSGTIWGLSHNGVDWQNTELVQSGFSITSFGQGEDGSVYVSAQGDGIYLISDGDVVPEEKEITINSGLNDAWYNPDTDGQGFFITVFPDLGYVSLAWFTYDSELPSEGDTANLGDPGHRWLTALGDIDGNKSVMGISIASGGIFDTPTDIERIGDGTIILTFSDCSSGTVEYDIPSIGQQGTVPIQRVAADNIALCEALVGD